MTGLLLNPWGLSATALLVWAAVAHAIGDFPLQTSWMARYKASRRSRTREVRVVEGIKLDSVDVVATDTGPGVAIAGQMTDRTIALVSEPGPWWDRHPAAYLHASVHAVLLLPVLGAIPALVVALVHLVIDTRTPIVWLQRRMGHDMPTGDHYISADAMATGGEHGERPYRMDFDQINAKVRFHFAKPRPHSNDPAVQAVLDAAWSEIEVKERLDRLETDLREWTAPVFDLGTWVRFQVDQTAHLAVLAGAALVIGAL